MQAIAERDSLKRTIEDLTRDQAASNERLTFKTRDPVLANESVAVEMDVLKAQSVLYLEDCERERQDRLRAQRKVKDLQSERQALMQQLAEYRHSHQQVHVYRHRGIDECDGPMAAGGHHNVTHVSQPIRNVQLNQPFTSDVSYDRVGSCSSGDDVTDAAVSANRVDVIRSQGQWVTCAQCDKRFPLHRHLDLLDHYDTHTSLLVM